MIAFGIIAASVAYIFWSTHRYLNPPSIHRRAQLSMKVRGGQVRYSERSDT